MTTVTANPGSHELSYERVFQAPPELVYRAHTRPTSCAAGGAATPR